MKKIICTFLAIIMVMSLVACKGPDTPATNPIEESTPIVTESVVETEPIEETEAPTEPRVPPTDFEAVDPATLPDPIPVEEQLLSEDTQTVTFETLEEYEDLLWELGFKEVRLVGTHEAYANETGNRFIPVEAYCKPVGLTYNNNAFRFDFTYCMTTRDGETIKEDDWFMYGTKSTEMANVSPMDDEKFYDANAISASPFVTIVDGSQFGSAEEILAAFQAGTLQGETTTSDVKNSDYEEDIKQFGLVEDNSKQFTTKTVYYPITGNLYNYMRSPYSMGASQTAFLGGAEIYTINVGMAARTMCFHYLFPEE